jgi:formylglycine-generating enzyme required for sulfatase activity
VVPKPTVAVEPVPKPNTTPTTPPVLEYTETITGASFVMKRVNGGIFQMGSNEDGADAKPIHSVEVSSFYMAKYEVTVGEYLKFCNATSTHYPEWLEINGKYHFQTGTDDLYKARGYRRLNEQLPIAGISWDDAVAYCAWLSKQTGKTYRLPTEAEWEYAARGGQLYSYAGSNSATQVSRCILNSLNSLIRLQAPVGSKLPNAYGLYDMSGSVWEWCSDWYNPYTNDARTTINPVSSADGTTRVVRGGSYCSTLSSCRVSNRFFKKPTHRDHDYGFRVVSFP